MMRSMIRSWKMFLRRIRRAGGPVVRDPRYVIVLTLNLLLLLAVTIQAYDLGTFDSVERPLFSYINQWPKWLSPVFITLSAFGSLLAIPIWSGVAYLVGHIRAFVTVASSTVSAWFLAMIMKFFVDRGRPADYFDAVRLVSGESFSSNGFPSSHAAISAAAITALYYLIDRKYRRYVLGFGLLIGASRIYLGGHFPLDIVGGWALGASVASLFCLAVGTRRLPVSRKSLRRLLRQYGIKAVSIRQLKADARGSMPYVATSEDKREYFVKVFGKQEHAADWLFKSFRFFRYKSEITEEAYVTSKRNVEIEALGTLLAKNAGVRTPRLHVMFKLGNRWVLVQEMIDAKTLSSFKKIQTKTLVDIFRQLRKLHKANISHRDMRAENIMIDKSGLPYFIDFGFVEVAPDDIRKDMDVAQLLMALSICVGVKRTLDTAFKVLPAEGIEQALPYLQYSAFAAETVRLAKEQDGLLDELRQVAQKRLGIKEAPEADIERLNLKRLFGAITFGILLYVLIPQLEVFRGALMSLSELHPGWLLPVILTSLATYVAAGSLIYVLTVQRLKFVHTALVQFASSFVSKLVPGGVGSAALNIRYLHKSGLSTGQASGVIAAERTVGFLSLGALIVIVSLVRGQSITSGSDVSVEPQWLIIAAIVVASAAVVLYFFESLRRKARHFLKDALVRTKELASSPVQLALGLVAALSVTLLYIACLYFSLLAIGQSLGVAALLLTYLSAMVAKGISPTPGGLGALEAAMALALQGVGMPAADSYAAVVIYRLATYWVPLPFGLLAYRFLRNRKVL